MSALHVIDSRTAFPTQAARQLEILANMEAARKFFMPTQPKHLSPKVQKKHDSKAVARAQNTKCFAAK
jgi:hypothetical protein